MRRKRVIGVTVVGVILFLVISALLTRALNVSDAEQAAITNLIRAESGGDAAEAVSLVSGCSASASCRTRVARITRALERPGSIQVIQFSASSNFSLGSTLGTARVAWLAGSSLPRVQCVRVRHAGDVLAGFRIQLLEVSDRIESDSSCPSRF
jgi:hypothetical protein